MFLSDNVFTSLNGISFEGIATRPRSLSVPIWVDPILLPTLQPPTLNTHNQTQLPQSTWCGPDSIPLVSPVKHLQNCL